MLKYWGRRPAMKQLNFNEYTLKLHYICHCYTTLIFKLLPEKNINQINMSISVNFHNFL